MPPRTPVVTERTFYDVLLRIIREKGGSGVQEVQYNSVPDIQFDFLQRRWLLSVKIGETSEILKGAFLQYWRHKEESGLGQGLLLLLPESMMRIAPTDASLVKALAEGKVTVLIDAGPVKEEVRDRTFSDILELIRLEVTPLLQKGVTKHYPLPLVIGLLRARVVDMMGTLTMKEEALLKVVTDRNLLTNLGSLAPQKADDVARFLAAYIILSQILFLRLFSAVHPEVVTGKAPMSRVRLRRAFRKILDINYRPIYELDVLDLVADEYLRDTFDLIWGLEVEKIRYELPGRIFHELMPTHIRKLLAAFYTRPQAAEILAHLAIRTGTNTVFDPASGSGTILVSAYRAKLQLYREEGRLGNPHKRYCEDEIFGADIMPFAVHLTSANLAAMDVGETIERTQIIQGDSIDLVIGRNYPDSLVMQLSLYQNPRRAKKTSGEEYDVTLDRVDAVLMNPPFTKAERRIRDYVDMTRFAGVAGGEVGLWGHFIFLANEYGMNGYIFIRKLGASNGMHGTRGGNAAAMRRRAEISYSSPHTNQTVSRPSPPGSQVVER